MKKFFQEFKEFIQRGSVLDLAVGIIIGGAFNTIVKSLVNDILMPAIGLIGGTNIQEAKIILVDAVMEGETILKPAVTLNYGSFLQTIIDFLIVSLTIFVIVKVAGATRKRAEKLKKKYEEELAKRNSAKAVQDKSQVEVVTETVKPTTEELLIEIRDLLAKKEVDKPE